MNQVCIYLTKYRKMISENLFSVLSWKILIFFSRHILLQEIFNVLKEIKFCVFLSSTENIQSFQGNLISCITTLKWMQT